MWCQPDDQLTDEIVFIIKIIIRIEPVELLEQVIDEPGHI